MTASQEDEAHGWWLYGLHVDGGSEAPGAAAWLDPSHHRSPPFLGWKNIYFSFSCKTQSGCSLSGAGQGDLTSLAAISASDASQLMPPLPPLI